ncbi:MAG: transglutaminase domain-containing protein, partial [Oscillospiraceae bacterium]|nr:transglutaminase domain-containing protein [Oscillospiraceae bacterium]
PTEPLTWAEAVDMIASLAEVSFSLGSQDPEAPITYGELLRILAAFVPQNADYAALSLPEMAAARGWLAPSEAQQHSETDPVSRQMTAVILNRVLHRHPEPESLAALPRGSLVDVPETSPFYGDILEALVPHDFESAEGREHWLSCTALPALPEGPLFYQGRLRWVLPDGSLARSAAVGRLHFDAEGDVTTGDRALDELVFAQFRRLLGRHPERSLDSLKVLYDYTRRSFEYRRRNYYAPGDTGWEIAEALTMLREGSGNCYNYTAVFCELSRFLGYDTRAVSGQVFQKRDEEAEDAVLPMTPHAWCEIELDGEARIFDPEYEYRYRHSDGKTFFNAGAAVRGQFGYEE